MIFNALAPRNLNEILDVIFKQILVIDGWGISREITLIRVYDIFSLG